MSTSIIGKLERVPLRQVWEHEAYDFTSWLQENIDVLNEALDLTLVNVDREQAAGSFSIDLVAEDEGGGTVIIENQLEKSNHDHLGKLITYLTAMNAKAAVWIVSEPRPEHVAAMTWLNDTGSAQFYMVKVEAVRIGESPAAPLFTLIVGPSDDAEEVGQTKKAITAQSGSRKRWWAQLIARSATRTKLHAHITPGEHSYIGSGTGIRGLQWIYTVGVNDTGAELYIDRGKGGDEENESIFEQLLARRTEIEQAAQCEKLLSWERLETKRACRIRWRFNRGGFKNPEDQWPGLQDEVIDAMIRLEAAMRPWLKQIKGLD